MTNFSGVKIALFCKDEIIVIQRDDTPGLRFAGMWDLPGGGRDNGESPVECAIREVQEELSILLNSSAITWQKTYPAMHDPHQIAYFMVADVSPEQVGAIRFGDEGQGWRLMAVDKFMKDQSVVGPLKRRLKDYLENSPE